MGTIPRPYRSSAKVSLGICGHSSSRLGEKKHPVIQVTEMSRRIEVNLPGAEKKYLGKHMGDLRILSVEVEKKT